MFGWLEDEVPGAWYLVGATWATLLLPCNSWIEESHQSMVKRVYTVSPKSLRSFLSSLNKLYKCRYLYKSSNLNDCHVQPQIYVLTKSQPDAAEMPFCHPIAWVTAMAWWRGYRVLPWTRPHSEGVAWLIGFQYKILTSKWCRHSYGKTHFRHFRNLP